VHFFGLIFNTLSKSGIKKVDNIAMSTADEANRVGFGFFSSYDTS